MATELLWLVLGGLFIGALGRLVLPSRRHRPPWPAALAVGVGGAVGAGLVVGAVLGVGHEAIHLVVSVALGGLTMAGYSVYRRARALPPW